MGCLPFKVAPLVWVQGSVGGGLLTGIWVVHLLVLPAMFMLETLFLSSCFTMQPFSSCFLCSLAIFVIVLFKVLFMCLFIHNHVHKISYYYYYYLTSSPELTLLIHVSSMHPKHIDNMLRFILPTLNGSFFTFI